MDKKELIQVLVTNQQEAAELVEGLIGLLMLSHSSAIVVEDAILAGKQDQALELVHFMGRGKGIETAITELLEKIINGKSDKAIQRIYQSLPDLARMTTAGSA